MLDQRLERLVTSPAFGTSDSERRHELGPLLDDLTSHHIERCPEYANYVAATFPEWSPSGSLVDLPFVPIGLYKLRDLRSVPDDEVFRVLTSSGTGGGSVSRVSLDRATAKRQSRALTLVMQQVLGSARRPMLVIDSESVVDRRQQLSARGAGVLGMMAFGRHHTFALDSEMRPLVEDVRSFLVAHEGQDLLVFGFTFMIWQHLAAEMGGMGLDLRRATVIHSGGWKRLEAERVSNEDFKQRLRVVFGVQRVFNFYGMAEQVGSVFLEGDDGLLHPSRFADVIVRNPVTWQEQPVGVPGLLQVLSAIPTSYPGHSILTEDLGVIEAIDNPDTGHGGKAFRVIGRLPKAELRGCSDTYAGSTRA